jgi:glycosyltransferase involved in cell wall biosynthesis
VPSRQDNFPNTAIEAHACGTPVVAFRTGGLSDIVEHKRTGYLAYPFEPSSLAEGISWVLDRMSLKPLPGKCSRERAIQLWNQEKISRLYHDVYLKALSC